MIRRELHLAQFVEEVLFDRRIQHAHRFDLVQGSAVVHLDVAPEGVGLHLLEVQDRTGDFVRVDAFLVDRVDFAEMLFNAKIGLSLPYDTSLMIGAVFALLISSAVIFKGSRKG